MDIFDQWNTIKRKLDNNDLHENIFPKRGEIWMSHLGKNIGYEQNGTSDKFLRPVLIIKKFNNKMFWGIPLSMHQKPFDFYYNFTDPENNNVSAILAQMKLLSVKRLRRKMYDLSPNIINEIRNKLIKMM